MPQARTHDAHLKPRALNPEVVDPRLADVEALARWMDDAIRVAGGFSIGLDGLLGLIPGIGDAIGGLISLYIVWRAMQLGVRRVAIARMLVNIGIDTLVGSIPIVGDTFDFAWKSNRKNVDLLKSHLAQPHHQSTRDWLFLSVLVLVLIAVIALPVWAVVTLLSRITL